MGKSSLTSPAVRYNIHSDMTESTERTEAGSNGLSPTVQKSQRSSRDEIVIPERPADGLVDGEPIPETWAQYGQHMSMTRFDQRMYAATVKEDGDEILIKYIHPTNPDPMVVSYDAVETEAGKVAPEELVNIVELAHRLGKDPEEITKYNLKRNNVDPFPISFGVGYVNRDAELDEPTTAERELIWSLHGDYLRDKTLYTPPAE